MENITDPFTQMTEEQEVSVVWILPHPLHGRLVERVILWVRPHFDLKGQRYKLTWWGEGLAYYRPVSKRNL